MTISKKAAQQAHGLAEDFERLCQMDAGLRYLLERAREQREKWGSPQRTARRLRWTWYEHYKPKLETLAGWAARNREKYPILGTIDAYDIAYEKVFRALEGSEDGRRTSVRESGSRLPSG